MDKYKYGVLSVVMPLIGVILFFLMRGPNASLLVISGIFIVLALLGITFTILSKRWEFYLIGFIANIPLLFFAGALLLAYGLSGD